MSTLTAQTIDLYAGEAHTINVAVTKNAIAVNLTGHVLTFEAKRAVPTATADIAATSAGAGAIVITNAAGGLAEIRFTAALTAWALAYGAQRTIVLMTWDLWDSATPEPIATGSLKLWRLPQS